MSPAWRAAVMAWAVEAEFPLLCTAKISDSSF
jgi:hypothetical protein